MPSPSDFVQDTQSNAPPSRELARKRTVDVMVASTVLRTAGDHPKKPQAPSQSTLSYLVLGCGSGALMALLLLLGAQPTEFTIIVPAAAVGASIGVILWILATLEMPVLEMPNEDVLKRLAGWALLGSIIGATIGLVHREVGQMFGYTFVGFAITAFTARVLLLSRLRAIFESDALFNIARTIVLTVVLNVGIKHADFVRIDTVKDALDLASIPASARDISCRENTFPDYAAACQFKVAPHEFDKLLSGRPFHRNDKCAGSSHEITTYFNIGEDFPVSNCYYANLPHNGEVRLYSDAAGRRVAVELAIP